MDHLFYDPAKAAVHPPNVDGCNVLINGTLRPWKGTSQPVVSPVRKQQAVSQGQRCADVKIDPACFTHAHAPATR